MVNNYYSASINDLFILCEKLEEFKKFNNDLLKIMSNRYDKKFAFQLWDLSNKKIKLYPRKVKRFYKENKAFVDTINKYSNIKIFIALNYTKNGNMEKDLDYFYQYILKNKKNIKKIKSLLEKIKYLGFNKVNLNEQKDFREQIYKIHINKNDNFVYLNNMILMPESDSNVISYKTKNSKYKIVFDHPLFMKSYHCYKKIFLNDLTFNSNELPDDLLEDKTLNKIINLKNEKQQSFHINNSLDLNDDINNLYITFNNIILKVNNMENINKKDELIKQLETIEKAISEIQVIKDEYDKKINCNFEIMLDRPKKLRKV